MRRKIKIFWSKPMSIDEFRECDSRFEKGLYYISRINGGHETLLYIGKTYNSFINRIESHIKNHHWWITQFPDTVRIRLGFITYPANYTKADLCSAESGLIFEMKPVGNSKQTKEYSYNYKYQDGNTVRLFEIYNEGNKKALKAKISMYEQE